jgi:hypothetical protein
LTHVAAALDEAERLDPGSGRLDLRGYVTPEKAGVSLDLEARINRALSGYGTAWVEADRAWRSLDYGAAAGLRLRW